jgi:heparin binding hemagglutinin HbhA
MTVSVNLPTAQDVQKARRQATIAVAGAFEQARMPLYAALGAGDLATETVVTYAKKARGDADTNQARLAKLQVRLAELPADMSHLPARMRTGLHELSTELAEVRGKLETTDMRELVEGYRRALLGLYGRLAVRGERVYGQIVAQPQVQRAVSRVGNAADTAEVRVERFVEEARSLADEVLGRVATRTRSADDKAAGATMGTVRPVPSGTAAERGTSATAERGTGETTTTTP